MVRRMGASLPMIYLCVGGEFQGQVEEKRGQNSRVIT
jgi:hypothetical protein